MRVRFWGVRGSIAKPGPATVRYGGNTSCVEVTTDAGHTIILDAGTGLHALGAHLLERPGDGRSGHILISHTHWDHIQGIPFFAPLFAPGNSWSIYGPRGMGATLREVLSGQMQHTYFPVALDQLGADIRYRDLIEGELDLDGVRVVTHYNHHPGLTLAYRVEADGAAVVYATDHEPFSSDLAAGVTGPAAGEDGAHRDFMRGADLVIHDAQYTARDYASKRGWGHSTVEYAVDQAGAANARRLALFHHDPGRSDDEVDGLLREARRRARDRGMALEISAAAEGVEHALEAVREPADVPVAISRSALLDPDRHLAHQTCLVATEDEGTRAIVAEAVAGEPYRVAFCDTPAALAAAAAQVLPTLVLLEQHFGGSDTAATVGGLRAAPGDGGDTEIVVMGDETDGGAAEALATDGVTGWLERPFTSHYLRVRLRAWLTHVECRWQPAPAPPDEPRRVAALHRLEVLDTPEEERFDRFTRLAAAIFEVPTALVSLVDSNRQWFKSHHGLEVTETPRDMAFCAHAILADDVLYIKDARNDPRFADNPLVTGDPHVRFYAGVPLDVGDGLRAGTLCLIDHRPRYLSPGQLAILRDLGHLVVEELRRGAPAGG